MKKFLGKLPVMITFVALAVVMLVAYIGLLVRPVAVGFTYNGQKSSTSKYAYEIKNGEKLVAIYTEDDNITKNECWYFVKDRYLFIVGYTDTMTEKEFENEKKEILKNLDFYKEKYAIKTNAFKIERGPDMAKCTGSIVFAIVGGVVLVALLTFGTLSVLYFVKGKRA